MRILHIETDRTQLSAMILNLEAEAIVLDGTSSAEEGLELAKIYDYDLILLGSTGKNISVSGFLKKIRTQLIPTPVLVLGITNDIEEKLSCFAAGADDVLTQPFDKRELIARIYALIRRSKGHPDSIIKTGEMEINLTTKIVTINNQVLHLTAKEYALLELLALRKGTTLSKEQFLNHLYGGMDEPEMKIIDVFFCKMRRKIKKLSGGEDYIQTVWGRGYILKEIA